MQATDSTTIVVSKDNWESIKATFMLIVNSTDSKTVWEICDYAIGNMSGMEAEPIGFDVNSEDFQEMVNDMMSSDIFSTARSGLWAHGFEIDESLGWLILEEAEGKKDEATCALAVSSWRLGGCLPKGWHRLDRATATRAVLVGIIKFGHDYFLQGGADANDLDAVLQEVILGRIVYC